MTDFKEEAYVLEKMEISEDEDDGFEYKEIKEDDELLDSMPEEMELLDEGADLEDDDDLNDFTKLKLKTEQRKEAIARVEAAKQGVIIAEAKPKTVT